MSVDSDCYYFSDDDVMFAKHWLDKVNDLFFKDDSRYAFMITNYPIFVALSYIADPNLFHDDQNRCGKDYIMGQVEGIDAWVNLPKKGNQLTLTDDFNKDLQAMIVDVTNYSPN